jgi:hypothetical protein
VALEGGGVLGTVAEAARGVDDEKLEVRRGGGGCLADEVPGLDVGVGGEDEAVSADGPEDVGRLPALEGRLDVRRGTRAWPTRSS